MATTQARAGSPHPRRGAAREMRDRDGCAVETAPLAAMLDAFVRDWNRTRPPTAGQFAADDADPLAMSGLEYLEERAGLPVHRIEAVLYARRPVTELWVADALVAAIDRPEAWHDGTLEVQPNPTAAKSKRAACCSGSSGSTPAAAPASLTGTVTGSG